MAGSVAFVCAMPMELAPLRRRLSLKRVRAGSCEFYSGSLAGRPAVATVTGMGGVLAARGLGRLLGAVDVERVVVVGITGALRSDTAIGSLVVPEVVVYAASGAEHRPARLGEAEPQGKMWTTDELVTDPEAISRLRADGVVALDMETAVIAEACEELGIPWSVFRAVSDRASDASLDDEVFALINPDGSYRRRAIVGYFLRHPGRLRAMVTMSKDARLAAENAAAAAVRAVERLSPAGESPSDR